MSLISTSCASGAPTNVGTGSGVEGIFSAAAQGAGMLFVLKELNNSDWKLAAGAFGSFWIISQLQKENPQFFNSTMQFAKSPWVMIRKKLEVMFCGGESLSWNELVTWRNRIMRLLSPLTKQTSVVDLSREKRLRLIDQEDTKGAILDEQWTEYVDHIQAQLAFMSTRLTKHLNYYETQVKKTRQRKCGCVACVADKFIINPPLKAVNSAGKACMQASVVRNEEIAFYLKEVKTYLKEIIDYSKSVSQLQSLDKERVKRVMNSTCDAFEHIATLVDAGTASSSKPPVGQLTMQRETSSSGYGGYGYGGYGTGSYN
jgi:hypothetical protein